MTFRKPEELLIRTSLGLHQTQNICTGPYLSLSVQRLICFRFISISCLSGYNCSVSYYRKMLIRAPTGRLAAVGRVINAAKVSRGRQTSSATSNSHRDCYRVSKGRTDSDLREFREKPTPGGQRRRRTGTKFRRMRRDVTQVQVYPSRKH